MFIRDHKEQRPFAKKGSHYDNKLIDAPTNDQALVMRLS